MEVDPNGAVYKVLDPAVRSRDGLMDFLAQPSVSLYDSLAAMVGSFWWWNVHVHAGEQRNAKAWNYWNGVPDPVKQEQVVNGSSDRSVSVKYVIYAGGGGSWFKLSSSLEKYMRDVTTSNDEGISIDTSPSRVFVGRATTTSEGYIRSFLKSDLSQETGNDNVDERFLPSTMIKPALAPVNMVTYGADNFLYVSTQHPSIEKWDPVSLEKVQENTDLWASNASYTIYEWSDTSAPHSGSFDSTSDGNGDQTGFRDWFDSTAADSTTSGDYTYPTISFGNGSYSQTGNVSGTLAPKLFRLPQDYYAFEISMTINRRGEEDVQFYIAADGAAEFLHNGSYVNGTYDNSTLSSSSKTSTVSVSQGDTITVRHAEIDGSDALEFKYRLPGETTWRNVPVFSGSFEYLNYDSGGTLFTHNEYGIFKWDAQSMVCIEVQPFYTRDNTYNAGGIAVNDTYLYTSANQKTPSNYGGFLRFQKSDLKVPSTNKFNGSVIPKDNTTAHFNSEGNVVFTGKSKVSTVKPDFSSEVHVSSELNTVVGGPSVQKITVLPDGTVIVGDGNGILFKLNSDLTDTGARYTLPSACTGLVYDVELNYSS
jgi:hypothetical protein